MKKINRLQWIPMLIKAYGDVRVMMAIDERMKNGENQMLNGPEMNAIKIDKARNNTVKNNSTKKDATVQPKSSIRRPIRPVGKSKKAITHPIDSFLHELRETQRKLSHVEAIHEQVKHMQTHLDNRLEEIMERIGNKNRQE